MRRIGEMSRGLAWRGWLLLLPLVPLCTGCMESDRLEVSIQRHFATAEEEALIGIAEGVCPDREDALAAAAAGYRDTLESEAGEDCLWWYDRHCIRIPYAITAGAIDYYVARIDQLRQVPSLCLFYPSALLDYEARVEFRDSVTNGDKQYENVYLADMTLSYSEMVAWLAGTGFEKQRHVLLTPEGEVLAVFGDGTTEWWVS
jgi:hypothetical protein